MSKMQTFLDIEDLLPKELGFGARLIKSATTHGNSRALRNVF